MNKAYGYVYVIRMGDTDWYKIGRSRNPATRLRELQTGNPLTLRLVAAGKLSCPAEVERQLHRHYQDEDKSAAAREWFRLTEHQAESLAYRLDREERRRHKKI